MEKEVAIPSGVQIDVKGREVLVKGPKGSLNRTFSNAMFDMDVSIAKADGKMVVKGNDRRKIKSFVGAVASHIENMILGVTNGYRYKLKIFHTHFPITLEVKGKQIVVKNFLGSRSVRSSEVIGNTKIEVKKDDVTVTGINKEDVSQTAANIEGCCRISGRDRRVFLDGIYITGWEIVND
jgi:large subunit ribosomal protein L6